MAFSCPRRRITLEKCCMIFHHRRIATTFAVIFCFLTFPFFSSYADTAGNTQTKWPQCTDRTSRQTLSFVHISDMHANYNPDSNGVSPMARVRGFYEKIKAENPYTVFTNAGDDYEKGSIAEEMSHGGSTRQVVQALGYDIRTLGNHDFAWGIKELLLFAHDPTAAVLSTNSTINRRLETPLKNVEPGFTDFVTLQIGCLRVGFFGLTARPYDDDGKQHEGLVYPEIPALEMNFDYLGIAKEVIAKHREEVDLLVLVSHIGLDQDIALAERTEGIDVILGGHSHSILDKPLKIKNTEIVHVGAYAEHIGHYQLTFDLQKKRIDTRRYTLVANSPDSLPSDNAVNQAIANIVTHYHKEIAETVTTVQKDHSRQEVADIAAKAAVETLQADGSFIGYGSVWEEFRKGNLTRQDILNTFRVEREPVGTPGTSSLYLMEVIGADLLQARATLANAAYWGPRDINPTAIYTIAVQKPLAFNQTRYFSKIISLSPPQPVAELWQVITTYAGRLATRHLALDETTTGRPTEEFAALTVGELKGHLAL